MDPENDPNAPDCTDGDFFCRLCLASMNSEAMWSSHVAGKRHIKNAQKYPNGIPKRRFLEDEDSYERPAKQERYDNDYAWGNDYPPPYENNYYCDDYYNNKPPVDYVPAIKPDVFDYGHKKKLDDEISSSETKKPEGVPPKVNIVPANRNSTPPSANVIPPGLNYDDIINEIVNGGKKKEKDDFFEKINQRELAKDIANELAKKCFYKEEKKVTKKDSKPGAFRSNEKHGKESPDIFDMFHKHNDKKLFKISNEREPKKKSASSISERSKSQLNDFDPEKLTPDAVDDLLSAQLKLKAGSSKESKGGKLTVENKTSQDDFKLTAEKLDSLPTMPFLHLIHKKLKNIDLKSSEELKMLVKIISEAQAVICKKLPSHLQALVKAKLSGNDSQKVQASVQGTTISQSSTIAPIASPFQNTFESNTSVSNSSQIPLTTHLVSNPSQVQNMVSKDQVFPHVLPSVQTGVVSQNPLVSAQIQRTIAPQKNANLPPPPPPPFPRFTSIPMTVGGVSNLTNVSHPIQTAVNQIASGANALVNQKNWQQFQANPMYNYYMMNSMYQNRPATPSNVNSIPNASEQSKHQSSSISKPQPKVTREMMEALKQLQSLSEEYKKNNSTKKSKS